MIEAKFLLFVINDILDSEEYTLTGIANETQIPEEVISDIATSVNDSPSLYVSRKIIDLHRTVRPDFYREVVKKITHEYLSITQ